MNTEFSNLVFLIAPWIGGFSCLLAVLATVWAWETRGRVRTLEDLIDLVRLAREGEELPQHLVFEVPAVGGGKLPMAPGLGNGFLGTWLATAPRGSVAQLACLSRTLDASAFAERARELSGDAHAPGKENGLLQEWLRSFLSMDG